MPCDWTLPEGAQAAHTIIACLEHHAVDGLVQISTLTLSKLTCVSRRHIQQTVTDMERSRILTVLSVGRAHDASRYRLDHPERVSREIIPPTWTPERKEALRFRWPRGFAADLVEPLNALRGAPLSIRMIESMASKLGLKHDKEMLGKRSLGPGRKREPGPTRIGQPKRLVKEPAAGAVWAPRQAVFQTQPMVARCAFHGCPHKPLGRWCASHAEAMRRPADEIVAALELVA